MSLRALLFINLLTLLSYIYWLIWIIRKRLYEGGILKTRRLPCPVICIGNITTGGTGKTPAVITLTRLLQNKIPRTAVLTRGYKRRSSQPVMVVSNVNKVVSTPCEAGDEPYLIASTVKGIPVIAGADRYRTGNYAIDHFNTSLFILDDGYQHLGLHRDIDILLIDATNPIGNGRLLPKGILREPLQGISRADCIIISRANEGDKGHIEGLVRSYNKDSPVFYASYKAANITDIKGNTLGLDYITGENILLFSGIGNPGSFRKTAEEIGGKVKGEIIFPDHHWYTVKDMDRIWGEARSLSADAIMTTEKDAVRLIDAPFLSEIQSKIKILVLQVKMDIDKGFADWIFERVG